MIGALTIVLPLSVIGGIMALLITYEEMRHHMDRRSAIGSAVRTGVIAFIVLAALSVLMAGLLFAQGR